MCFVIGEAVINTERCHYQSCPAVIIGLDGCVIIGLDGCVIIGLDPIIYLFALLTFTDCRIKSGNDIRPLWQ